MNGCRYNFLLLLLLMGFNPRRNIPHFFMYFSTKLLFNLQQEEKGRKRGRIKKRETADETVDDNDDDMQFAAITFHYARNTGLLSSGRAQNDKETQ